MFTWPELPCALHERQPWGGAGTEPRLCEMLADPVMQAVMRRDGVSRAELESLVSQARQEWRRCESLDLSGLDEPAAAPEHLQELAYVDITLRRPARAAR